MVDPMGSNDQVKFQLSSTKAVGNIVGSKYHFLDLFKPSGPTFFTLTTPVTTISEL